MSGDYSNPWSAIASMLGGQATRNASESAKYAQEGQKQSMGWGRNDGMIYSSAPQLDRTASDNTTPAEVLGNIGDMASPGSKNMVKPLAGIGAAMQAEKDLYAPTQSAVSGYQQGPQNTIENVIDRFNQIYGRVYR